MEAQQAVNLFARGQYPVIALIVRKCYGSTFGSNPNRVGSIPTRTAIFVSATKRRRQRMTVWAQQSEIFEAMVAVDSVDVIYL